MIIPEELRQKGKYWTHGINLVEGCTRVSPGCANCWLQAMNKRFQQPYLRPDEVVFREDRLKRISERGGKPKVYSIWSDLFQRVVTNEQIWRTLAVCSMSKRDQFMVLTKRHARMRQAVDMLVRSWEVQRLYENIWLGVTAENQAWADKRIPALLETKAASRFVSLEPLLGPINLRLKHWVCTQCGDWTSGEILDDYNHCSCDLYVEERVKNDLDWVIVGCETGPNRRPCELAWIIDIVQQCRLASVPVWVKAVNVNGKVVNQFDQLPEAVRVRETPRSDAAGAE